MASCLRIVFPCAAVGCAMLSSKLLAFGVLPVVGLRGIRLVFVGVVPLVLVRFVGDSPAASPWAWRFFAASGG